LILEIVSSLALHILAIRAVGTKMITNIDNTIKTISNNIILFLPVGYTALGEVVG